MRLRWIALAGLILLIAGLLPLISVFLAGSIAQWAGCELHEGFANPCIIGDSDWGDTLYTLFVLGWLSLATWPLALAGVVVLVAAAILGLVRALRR